MPRSAARLCARCHSVVQGRCPTCYSGWRTRKPSSWSGVSTGGARWRKLRRDYLRAFPMCQWPRCEELATEVDHVDGTDYATQRYDWSMLRGLCTHHHRQRTTEQGNAAQRNAPDAR